MYNTLNKLYTESDDPQNYFISEDHDNIFLFLNFLLSKKFGLTKYASSYLTSEHTKTFETVQASFLSIYEGNENLNKTLDPLRSIEQNTPFNSQAFLQSMLNQQNVFMLNMQKQLEQGLSSLGLNNNNSSSSRSKATSFTMEFDQSPDENKLEKIKVQIKNLKRLLLTKKNHLSENEAHLLAGTTPAALFYNHLPNPFLKHNAGFIDAYNELCNNFQILVLEKTNHFLKEEISSLEIDIDKYNEENPCDQKIIGEVETELAKELAPRFESKAKKRENSKAIKWEVLTEYTEEKAPYKNFNRNNSHSNKSNNSTPDKHRFKRRRSNSRTNNGQINNSTQNQYNHNNNKKLKVVQINF